MGNLRGFLDFKRVGLIKLEPEEKIKNYKEFSSFWILKTVKIRNAANEFLSE